jgi:uncharacterized membrane protein SpoIIM required for sporulation/uncharacterized RDD family membrane protein YckC
VIIDAETVGGASETTTPEPGDGFAQLDRARVVRIETPEHVGIGFELAAIGSRSAAVVVDVIVSSAAAGAISLLVTVLDQVSESELLRSLGTTGALFALFAIQWGYFFVSEGFFDGRTIGKKALGLRVIGAGGTPITLQAAALRNLLRIIDFQPVGSSLVGLGLIALHPKSQRLGDILAGTVVVRDRGSQEIPEKRSAEFGRERPRLDRRRFEVLEKYVRRRETLQPAVRNQLTQSVARGMGDVVANDARRTSMSLDELLGRLYREERTRQSDAGGTSMQAVQLVRAQSGAWNRCQELVDKASSRGLSSLSETELEEFTGLYREISADLARAHTYGGSLRLCFYLERLVGQAHNLFYQDRTEGFSVLEWIRSGFPRVLRRHAEYVAVSAALLFAPAFLTYAAVRDDVELGRRLAPPEMVTRAEEARERLDRGDPYIDVPQVQMSILSSRVMTNNIQVSLFAAAGGILAGIGTVIVLLTNGVHLGSVFALFDAQGAGAQLWTFVLPHGVLEMTAIVVAGAAGLVLAHALVAPGRRTRGRALREEGKESLSLVAGAGMLLVLAGLIEGFISPARIAPALKIGFATLVAVLMVLYFTSGRTSPEASRREAKAALGP